LILNAIGCLSSKLKEKITTLLTIDTDLDELTREHEIIKEKHDVTIIPTIYCINPFDMECLVNIFNNKIKSWSTYLKNTVDFDSFDEEDKYVCNICDTVISRKSDFIRHIKTHGYIEPVSNTKLHQAFIDIYNYLILKKKDEGELINLYKFILNDIDVQFYDCNDPEYVSRIFDWENNRGCSVEALDIIKNPILAKILDDDKKIYVYNKWEKLKHTKNNIYKQNFGQKIFDIAIQIYNNLIKRTINHEELFRNIINNHDTYGEVCKFFTIVEELFSIMDKISNDRFGRLINNTPRICLNWEGYMWCLIPIIYVKKGVDSKLIKLMTKWYFRNLQFRTRSFNNLCYSNRFISITNEFLSDNSIDYYSKFEKCLVDNKNEIIDNNYQEQLKTMTFKSTNATHILLFLETCINTDIHTVPLEHTLEHIYCQKDKAKLRNPALLDNIGNLTLLEGSNSNNGHKGNCSLGKKPYVKKRGNYLESNSKITRDLANEYTEFGENQIIDRNIQIVKLLDEFTRY